MIDKKRNYAIEQLSSTEEDKLKILEEQGYTFKGNHHPDSFKYNAHGLLSNLRIGYMVK